MSETTHAGRVRRRPVRWQQTSRVFRTLLLLTIAIGTPFGLPTVGIPTADATTAQSAQAIGTTGVYTNPLPLLSAEGRYESCPDPAIIRGQTAGDTDWYLYCTTDPRNGDDRTERGRLNFRLLPTFRSHDLVNWTFVSAVFAEPPAWVTGFASFRAPEITYFNSKYYLYFTVGRATWGEGGSAIGVATSDGPTGPWTVSDAPVVEPQVIPSTANGRRWVYDPTVVTDADGSRYLFYGSYVGGIAARKLSADGLRTDAATETPITAADRYEGAAVVRHGGEYYLFVSAANCCRGPLTGYAVFVGRATSILGPYRDREGVSLLDSRVGGTPLLAPNGNRWIGPGHAATLTDFGGQDWLFYHAVDRNDPYFAGFTGFTKRPLLLDPLDWVDGWPSVRGGQGPSDSPQAAPAAQPGEQSGYARPHTLSDDTPGSLIEAASDEFVAAPSLRSQWQWVRPPARNASGLPDGTLRLATQPGELYLDTNTAPVLTEAAPAGEYTVETRVRLNVPATGCCQNYVQAGLVIYADDDNYLKLTHVSIAETRQIEWAKEIKPTQPNYPRYGNTVLGPPGEWTFFRITKRIRGGEEQYTAFSSTDGRTWTRGGTWAHTLGVNAKIGLVAFGGAGFVANFDYVRVYNVR